MVQGRNILGRRSTIDRRIVIPHRSLTRSTTYASLLLLLLVPDAGARDEPKGDQAKLQGAWKPLVVMTGDPKRDRELLEESAFEFAGNKFITTRKNKGRRDEVTFTLNPEAVPREINLYSPLQEDALLGIYAIEGDRLQLSWSRTDGKDRPRSFNFPPLVQLAGWCLLVGGLFGPAWRLFPPPRHMHPFHVAKEYFFGPVLEVTLPCIALGVALILSGSAVRYMQRRLAELERENRRLRALQPAAPEKADGLPSPQIQAGRPMTTDLAGRIKPG